MPARISSPVRAARSYFQINARNARTASPASLRRAYAADSSMPTDPQTVSQMAKAEGGATKGSPAAKAQSQMTKEVQSDHGNPGRSTGSTIPSVGSQSRGQSQSTKEADFDEAMDRVGSKMQNEPGSVTQQDASYLSSAETRATGGREKGGPAAQAESLADQNKN